MNKTLLYPLVNDKETTWLPREDWIPLRFGQLSKDHPNLTTKRVRDILELLEAGLCNPAEMESWMSEIADDVTLAKERSESALVNEKSEDIQLSSPELAVVQAASQENLTLGLSEILKAFDLGELTRCQPKADTTDIQIGRAVEVMAGIKNWSELGLGDLLNALGDRGYSEEVIDQIISQLNIEESTPTIDKYRATARAATNDLRELPGLKFTHLAEVCTSRFSKDPVEQAKVVRECLMEASERGLNVAQTRELALVKKGKSTKPTPPPEAPKPRYIMIDRESLLRGEIIITAAHKEPLCNESALCISIENLDYSTECHGNSLHAWQPIPTVDEVEPAPVVELEVLG